eukprot:NODE_1566_length_1456_cov_61.454477_g1485_i0.p1 GENE.NODE_1566_length_1456_cov_61.454477_g1485_i0~~NODE_1566_length_1456_cov_61.454477_g1485_i0.p1  ORF type:complete len:439 (+),score=151.06 NODE_1566_length_1456_cov_61.454477_g1485_i0:63-1319(+)
MPSKLGSEVEQYLRNCDQYRMSVDPSVVIALETGWSHLSIHQGCVEGCLLPLGPILATNTTITHLHLIPFKTMQCGSGDTNAKILAEILEKNTTITELDLKYNGIGVNGLRAFSGALRRNKHLQRLYLGHNAFGSEGGFCLADAVAENTTLQILDVSHNGLGWPCTQAIRQAAALHSGFVGDKGNYVLEEVLNSVTHGIGCLLAMVGTVVLLPHSMATRYHFWGALIYCASLITLYLSSTLYHSFFLLPHAHRIFQILDHNAIYLLIAGSYTPLCLVTLAGHTSGIVMVVLQWCLAGAGILMSTYTMTHLISPRMKKVASLVEVALYLLMGWMLVFAGSAIWHQIGAALPLIAACGVSYTIGVVFLMLDEVHPMFHPIFHLFVLAGSLFHYFAVLWYVMVPNVEFVNTVQTRVLETQV